MKLATYSECYQTLRSNDIGWFTSVAFAFIMWMRGTKIDEE